MTFSLEGFARVTGSGNELSNMIYSYTNTDDTLATIVASGYFDDLFENLTDGKGKVSIGDSIIVRASDQNAIVIVTAVTTAVTVDVWVPGNQSHSIVYAGTHTTAGGDVNETIAVVGMLATDLVFIQTKDTGVTAETVLTAAPATDAINVVLSLDPGTDTELMYQVVRSV